MKMSFYLDYGVFAIYYNLQLRFPNCVIENFNGFPCQPINRKDFTDKFQPDLQLPEAARMSKEEYDAYLTIGGSYGHNAPASFHKSSPQDYLNTFLLSNICPQEMTFNSGLWHLCETWTAQIIKHFQTVTVLTGSIKASQDCPDGSIFNRFIEPYAIHVPGAMYKIILIKRETVVYGCAYLFQNTPHLHESKLSPYLVEISTLIELLRTENGFEIEPLLPSVTLPMPLDLLAGVRGIDGFNLNISKSVRSHLRMAATYHAIIYATSLKELEEVMATHKITADQRVYYELIKKKFA